MLRIVHEYKKNTEGERKRKIVTWNLKMKEIFYNLHVLYYVITVKRNYDSVIHGSLWVNQRSHNFCRVFNCLFKQPT